MAEANLWAFLNELFAMRGSVLPGILGANGDNVLWVDSANGSVNGSGTQQDNAFSTIQAAVDRILAFGSAGSFILVAPGQYDETVTIARNANLTNLTIIGLGGRGAAFIEPTTEDASGMLVHSDDVSLYNLGVAGEDETSAIALTVTGARFRAYGCKFEGGLTQILIGPGTVAQEAAGTHGTGADGLFDDCEICWGTNGFVLQGTDYGGCTQLRIRKCRFHDLTAESVGENVGSGGSAAVTFFGLVVDDSVFEEAEDGTQPTNWFDLDADNANTGIVTGCKFTVALAGTAKNVVSTAVIWTGNFHTGGISTGQPS